MASPATSNSARARGSPNRATSAAASTLSPVSTWPPLRELAPQPIRSRSITATDAPAFASRSAAASPVYPAPTMTTSARAGNSEFSVLGSNF